MVAFATFSCRSLPFPEPHLEGTYGQELKKWTRQVALYSGLETRAFVRVVYLAPQFVNAQAQELSTLRAEPPDVAAQTLEKLRADDRLPSFFAIVYIPDRLANDWSEKDSVWRLALNVGMGEQRPQKVSRFERPFSPELRALYPYLDDYSVGYLIQFPDLHGPEGNNIDLVAAGALGTMRFHWRPDGSEPEPSTAQPGAPTGPVTSPKP